jgi:hypothetical protein
MHVTLPANGTVVAIAYEVAPISTSLDGSIDLQG